MEEKLKKILEDAKKLENKSFKEMKIIETKNKGFVGLELEKYFGLKNNNKKEMDFKQIGVNLELKTTPIKKIKNNFSPKERLVLSMINFNENFSKNFIDSELFKKIKNTLIVNYLHDKEKKFAKSWMLYFSKQELNIIQQDYELIINKIISGRAHELSEGDTIFLSAARKGCKNQNPREYKYSNIPAKSRAWSFKTSFMNIKMQEIYQNKIINKVNSSNFFSKGKILSILKKYLGKTLEEISKDIKKILIKGKSKHTNTIYAILKKENISKKKLIENSIFLKCQKLNKNAKLQEDISFSQINFDDIINWNFEQTEIYNYLTNGFIHIVFSNQYKLEKINLVQFSDKQIQRAKKGFDIFKQQLLDGKTKFIKKSDNLVIHVRPKAKNAKDTIKVNGIEITKQTLWINNNEIKI